MSATSRTHSRTLLTLLGIHTVAIATSFAGTVGLYSFDTLGRDWNQSGGPERFFDSSGNNLHFFANGVNGTTSLSSDVPPVAPAGSLSLKYNARAALDTPLTDLFTIGKTGQLTVEFWYKPQLTDTLRIMLSTTSGSNAWSLSQPSPPVNGVQGVEMFTTTSSGSTKRLKSQDNFLDAANPVWTHLAFTFDQAGVLRMYRNGELKDQATGFTPYGATSHTLRLGSSNPAGTFAGRFLIDDLRISNVALQPGNGSGVNELAWNASLSQGLSTPPPNPPTFARDWIRSNPFMISSWNGPVDLPMYKAANFNAALSSRTMDGIASHYLGSFTELNDDVRTSIQWGENLGVKAWLARDEVPADKLAGTADAVNYIRAVDPGAFVYVSLSNSNATYVQNLITTIKPDAIVMGYGPWRGLSNSTDTWWAALENHAVVRNVARQNGVPLFGYLQSTQDLNYDSTINDNMRLPSGSELRAQMFMKLSAGFKGFIYYFYDMQYASSRFEEALINREGNPSALYPYAAAANAEAIKLGKSLRYLESTDWRFLWGGVSQQQVQLPQWAPSAGSGHVTAINLQGTPTIWKDGLVGYFTDDASQDYLMLVNTWHGINQGPDALPATFNISFDNSVNSILRLNRLTGEPERLQLVNHVLTLTLPGGTGDLLKLNDGFFAGILPGDANLDDQVNSIDFNILAANYGGTEKRWGLGDFDLDGKVTTPDFNYLAGSFGSTPVSNFPLLGSQIPEPASGWVILATATLLHRRRKMAARM